MRFARFFSALLLLAAANAFAVDWNADLDALQREIPKTHANAFHATTQEAFDAAIARLRANAPSLPPHVVTAEIAKIAASIGDGHTRLTLPADFRHLPVRFTWFGDGLFVTSAEKKSLIGRKIVRIGLLPVDDALKAMAPFAAADNEVMRRLVVADLLAVPEMLHAAGIAASPDRVDLVVDNAKVTLEAIPFGADAPWLPKQDVRPFWFEQRDRIVYFAFNEVANGETETLAAFADRLFKFIDTHNVDTLVIDLRNNPGGNESLARPILHGIIRSRKLQEPGHLFVLIGRRTFSAAVNFATDLEEHTNAVFVGEPTGGRPNGFGEARKIVLPSSGLTVRVAQLYWQKSDPRDRRDAIPPHLGVAATSADFIAHRDLAMQTITHVARAMREKGSLDGNWTGAVTIEWNRIPMTITDHRVDVATAGVKDFAISEPKFSVDTAQGKLDFDLRVGNGFITGTMTANGQKFPLLLSRQ
jgi:hypothetical protein